MKLKPNQLVHVTISDQSEEDNPEFAGKRNSNVQINEEEFGDFYDEADLNNLNLLSKMDRDKQEQLLINLLNEDQNGDLIHLADPTLILKNPVIAEAQTQIVKKGRDSRNLKSIEVDLTSPLGPNSRVNIQSPVQIPQVVQSSLKNLN